MLVFMIAAQPFSAQKSMSKDAEQIVQTEDQTEEFNSIFIAGSFNVEIVQGETSGFELNGNPVAVKLVKSTIKNGILHLSLDRYSRAMKHLSVVITVKDLELLKVSGCNAIHTKDKLIVDELELIVTGANKTTLELEARHIETKLSGASQTVLTGSTNSFDCKLSGASQLTAYDLETEDLSISVSGTCNAKVHSNNELDITASGVSQIYYKGDAEKVSKRSSGISRIKAL